MIMTNYLVKFRSFYNILVNEKVHPGKITHEELERLKAHNKSDEIDDIIIDKYYSNLSYLLEFSNEIMVL